MADRQPVVQTVPWWGKVIVGVCGTYFLVKYTPIVELLSLFLSIVCIPIGLFVSLGLISIGTMEKFTDGWNASIAEINARVKAKVDADTEEKKKSEEDNRRQQAA